MMALALLVRHSAFQAPRLTAVTARMLSGDGAERYEAYLTLLRRGWRNHLLGVGMLHNRYFALRHGESEANVAHLISCLPDFESGLAHGLSPQGHEQAARSHLDLNALLGSGLNLASTHIYASDFRRTVETAEHLREGLGLPLAALSLTAALRERSFGPLNLQDDGLYPSVWEDDAAFEFGGRGVEPAAAVQARASSFIAGLEASMEGQTIVLVGHGDLLQIMQTAFEAVPASEHRSLPHLAQCELRELTLRGGAATAPDA